MIIAIIQARMNATRLPGKVLLDLEGATVLERVVERVAQSQKVNRVIVATTQQDDDDVVLELCTAKGIVCTRGSQTDVLDRYYQTAKQFRPTHVVRITADCPLMDASVIDHVIEVHLKTESDYTSNTIKETYPDGEDVEVMTFDALEKAWQSATLPSQREHVTPYLKQHPEIFKLTSVTSAVDYGQHRWTLDNAEDYALIQAIYKALYNKNHFFGMNDILAFLEQQPQLGRINQHIRRNEGYIKSLQDDKENHRG